MSRPPATSDARYPPIGAHGIIGDRRTAALVAADATIDFLCVPEFDSPTAFARLLDAEHGGHFGITLDAGEARHEQRYVRDTNVLVTRIVADAAEIEVFDFMPVERRLASSRIVRVVQMVRGAARVRCVCAPRFDYARATHLTAVRRDSALFLPLGGAGLRLTTRAPLRIVGEDVIAELPLVGGERVAFVLDVGSDAAMPEARVDQWAARALRRTIVYWRRWIAKSPHDGPWRTAVRRSALTLALLQSRRTGAVIAAPTFGLPEQIGGSRNWDFRYAWIRDSAFTVYALGRIGLPSEARAFSRWADERCEAAPSPGALQSIYRIDGQTNIEEQTLDHLEGYRRSRPIRIGNAAYNQLQLDIAGELIDALYQRDEHAQPTSRALWRHIVALTDWVGRNWQRPDQGIWEVRGRCQEFLYSRVMCWVAVDRALRIARRRRFAAPRDEWRRVRDAIHANVHAHFWNAALGAFSGVRGADSVDAACLVMPLVGFIDARDPRWQSTLRVIEARLVRDGLVRRYDMSEMDTDAGRLTAPSFTFCSFWYVECLAKAGERQKAIAVMQHLLGHANALGLYSEDLGANGELLGNFPQGLVHAALIGAAVALQ